MIVLKSKKVRAEVIVLSALLLIVGLFYSWLISHANKEYYTEVNGMTTEARRNPFLAARFFIEKRGGKISLLKDFSVFDEALDPADTVIITNSRKPLSERRLKTLHEFVTGGGHLILRAIESFDDEKSTSGAPILDPLGLRFYRDNLSEDIEFFNGDSESNKSETLGYHAKFSFEGDKQETLVKFSSHAYLIDASGDSIFQGGTETNDHFIRYQQGNGFITVLSDIDFWKNKDIEYADHAMFLHQLTRGKSKIWVVYNPQIETLTKLIWQHAYFIVIAAFAFLFFIIWHSQIKTGPVFSQFSTTRRQLIQHIQASANFKWRHTSLDNLLNKTRDNLLIQTKYRNRGFDHLPRNEQIDLLHNWTKLSKAQLSRAMFDSPSDQWLFQEQMKTLQKATNHLHGKHR